MNVAIVHDYLTQRGGAERVVLALCRAFPDAPLYTSLYDPAGTFSEFRGLNIRRLWLDRLSPLRSRHRAALPLLPVAWATSSVSADVVICSSSGWAHGVRTDGRKVVYCHSPAKWLYRTDDYLGTQSVVPARAGLRALSPALRRFDQWAVASANRYLANSTFIAGEIERVYGIEAIVVPPPAGLDPAGVIEPVAGLDQGFFLTVARLLPYKNVAATVDAFRDLNSRLVVVGDGPQREQLMATAPPNATFLGEVDDARLRWLYANCRGLVAASREDFGLTPVEAACFGKPVAALRWGGFLDTVVEGTTGVFFDIAEPGAIAATLAAFEQNDWDSSVIRRHGARFGEERFIEKMHSIIADPRDVAI
jgi:glycosyltransferase involved in cell wall biosynthesis